MATQWVLDKVSGALAPTVSTAVSSAGGFAGGAVNAVGNSVSGVGESINRTIRTYGDGVKDYGNSIMDWTSASGIRGATAQNPLGLSGTKTAGSRAVTSPSVYYAPASSKKTSAASTKKPTPAAQKSTPAKKAAPPTKSTNGKALPAKSTPAKSTTLAKKPAGAVNTGAMSGAGGQKKAISAASKPQPKAAAKPAAKKPDAHKPATYMSSKSASNPIGISW